ncbi:MAG: hypothetical protein LBE30_13320 [Comamonas sp.]|jgi:hypothetical protein|nr:hypothetical protein [Comamonas sp.]
MNHDYKNACSAAHTDEPIKAARAEKKLSSRREQLASWLQAIRRMLERAEKHIGENFRVPPNGG